MSRNEWERGEIKLSTKEFSSVRRDLIAFHNARQVRLFERAKRVYGLLKAAGKGKRGFDYHAAFELTLRVPDHQRSYRADDLDGYDEIFDAIFPSEQIAAMPFERSRKPKAPKKNQFAPLKQSVERIDVGGEAGIGFDRKRRVVTWGVAENNHSVERAHDHPIGREFFNRLSRVVWTRGTGGEIVGNDEYNQDTDFAGGGANYVTQRFGAAGKPFRKAFGR